jgi:hypothetical protein
MAKNRSQGRPRRFSIPDTFDPYDMNYKRQVNPAADDMNFLTIRNKQYILCCGARKRGRASISALNAGHGTDHSGVGRCKFHSGNSTGPKTPEGKAKVARNSTKSGLYARFLLPDEMEIYNSVVSGEREDSLAMEINLQKTKILSYIQKCKIKAQKAYELARIQGKTDLEALESMDDALKTWAATVTESEDGESEIQEKKTFYFHAGTIEDRSLDRALNTLGRLVEKHARINGETNQDELELVNAQLRAASNGLVQISWKSKGPARKEAEKDE